MCTVASALSVFAQLPRGMCIDWNELQYLACATSKLQQLLPGVRLPLDISAI